MNWFAEMLLETWGVLAEMAPYLLFGFAMAGLLSVFVSPEFVEDHLGKRGIRQVIKAAVLGVPLPLCSCSVIPVSASLRRHGASRGATLSFLVSTPQTGLDSIMVTHSLLGPVIVVFRVLTAFLSGVVAGCAIEFIDRTANVPEPVPDNGCSCCGNAGNQSRFIRVFRYGFVTLPQEIGKALVVGILISGLLSAVVPDNYFADKLAPGIISMIVMMLAGTPLYVCSSSSVPIALALIRMGVSPGAAFVFLVTGPATNVATLATVWKVLGKASAVVYLVTIAAGAIGAGLLLDRIIDPAGLPGVVGSCHDGMSLLKTISGVVLLATLLPAFLPKRKQKATE
jgi:uncharacterized membrane protein YraQ (UPF0718 family)